MNDLPVANAELGLLLAAAVDGRLTDADRERLQNLLATSNTARESYVEHVILHAMLHWEHAAPLGSEAANVSDGMAAWERDAASRLNTLGLGGSLPIPEDAPVFPHSLASSAASRFVLSSSFGGLLFSYILAAFIVGGGLLTGWICQVSGPAGPPIAQERPQRAILPATPEPERLYIGRITACVECNWVNPRNAPLGYERVAQGRCYDLDSGLLEITFDTGTRVILQGPCTYTATSTASGYLAVGMLTARIEEKPQADRRSGKESPAPSRQVVPAFTVNTPTISVADLGTEFGVLVEKSGASEAHVFRGKVEMRLNTDAKKNRAISLSANDSARVEAGGDRVAKIAHVKGDSRKFVQRMPKRAPIKLFSTGVGLKTNEPDKHWQIVARSDDRNFKPRPAVVTDSAKDMSWIPNLPERAQWISVVGGESIMPDAVVYTFRTTFDLTGLRPSTAVLQGRFAADNHVGAIRLNGTNIPVPAHGYADFGFRHAFTANRGFVEGGNVLEIDVENGDPKLMPASSTMSVFVELEGSALAEWPDAARDDTEKKQQNKDAEKQAKSKD